MVGSVGFVALAFFAEAGAAGGFDGYGGGVGGGEGGVGVLLGGVSWGGDRVEIGEGEVRYRGASLGW